MRIQLADPTELEDMLDAKAYEATLED
jgi:hypothetical protein